MKLKQSVLLGFSLLCLSGCLYAQSWSGILASTRAINWSNAGVVGGIPTRTTICATETSSRTYSQINTDIQNCPWGQVVYLSAGTYNLTSGLVMKAGVTLRGAGADQTLLVFTGHNSCDGLQGVVCIEGKNNIYGGSASVGLGGTNSATWCGGYAQGATQITLTGVGSSGISVGDFIYLDQANDNADNGNFFVCDNETAPCSLQGGSPGRTVSGVDRNQIQIVQVTGINGSTYTISPGLYAPNWRTGQSPGAWWAGGIIQGVGVENLSVDNTNSGGQAGIIFFNAANCWVQGVRSLRGNRNHVWMMQAAHVTVQNNYFYSTLNSSSLSYGVESFVSSDNLVLNNIFQQIAAPLLIQPSQGSVFGYNFSINDTYAASPNWMMESSDNHAAGAIYNLFEGNNGAGIGGDVIHGTSGFDTFLRNRLTGWETGKTGQTVAAIFYSYQRYHNVVGNVLGEPGYTASYQTSKGVRASASIYDLGAGDTEGSITVPSDSLVASTLMRWGNYDTVNAAVRFVSSEVPSGISPYGNAVPSSQTLPASFYYSSQPSWWPASKAWPPIGPDVTGGSISGVGGHAYTIPAQDCYLNVMGGPANGTGSVLSFNANTCYGPQPATNLTAVPH